VSAGQQLKVCTLYHYGSLTDYSSHFQSLTLTQPKTSICEQKNPYKAVTMNQIQNLPVCDLKTTRSLSTFYNKLVFTLSGNKHSTKSPRQSTTLCCLYSIIYSVTIWSGHFLRISDGRNITTTERLPQGSWIGACNTFKIKQTSGRW
jgi:hypothetical protein